MLLERLKEDDMLNSYMCSEEVASLMVTGISEECVKILLSNNVKILHFAMMESNSDKRAQMVDVIIKTMNNDMNNDMLDGMLLATDDDGKSPIMKAVMLEDVKSVGAMLKRIPHKQLMLQDGVGYNALMHVALSLDPYPMMEILLAYAPEHQLLAKCNDGSTVLDIIDERMCDLVEEPGMEKTIESLQECVELLHIYML
jgi:hypothetical protein